MRYIQILPAAKDPTLSSPSGDLIAHAIRTLEAGGRTQATQFYNRARQKTYLRMLFIQRMWNDDVKGSYADLVCLLSEAKSQLAPSGSAGAHSPAAGLLAGSSINTRTNRLELDHRHVATIASAIYDLTNVLRMAEAVVADAGDGPEEAGLECTL